MERVVVAAFGCLEKGFDVVSSNGLQRRCVCVCVLPSTVGPEENMLGPTRPKGRDVVGDGGSPVLDHLSLRWDKRRCGFRFNDTRIVPRFVHAGVSSSQEHFPGIGPEGPADPWVLGTDGSGPVSHIGTVAP